MAKVYDVVQTVTPEAAQNSSYQAGRHLVDFFDREADADGFAARCNECRLINGVYYDVVEVEELDLSRSYDD